MCSSVCCSLKFLTSLEIAAASKFLHAEVSGHGRNLQSQRSIQDYSVYTYVYIYCVYIANLCKYNIFAMGKMLGMHFAS